VVIILQELLLKRDRSIHGDSEIRGNLAMETNQINSFQERLAAFRPKYDLSAVEELILLY